MEKTLNCTKVESFDVVFIASYFYVVLSKRRARNTDQR